MRRGDFNTDDDDNEEEENNDDENHDDDFSAATLPINNRYTIAIHSSCNQLKQSFSSIQMVPSFQRYEVSKQQ